MDIEKEKFKDMIIMNSHYFNLEINITSRQDNYTEFTRPYFMYNGKSKRFTGTKITDDKYGSIELPFG